MAGQCGCGAKSPLLLRPLHAGASGGAGCGAADSHHLACGAAPPTLEFGGGVPTALPEWTGTPA
eukprot:11849925-Prorocentrum_lima.AAC.1